MFWSSHNRGAGSCFLRAGTAVIALAPFHATECLAQPRFGIEADALAFVSDNPFLMPGDDTASGAIDVAARPYLDWDLDPRTRLEATAELGLRQYFRRYGNYFKGFGEVRLNHRHNEYLTVTAEAKASRDLVSDILTDSIDLAYDNAPVRESSNASASVIWNPNANLTITGDGGWERYRYPGSTILQTTNAFSVGTSARKRISERTSIGAEARFTSSKPVGGEKNTVATFSLLADHHFSARWHGDIRLGAEWPDTNPGPGGESNDRTRFHGQVNLCYEPQFTTACLTGSVGTMVSALGGLQREYSLEGTLRTQVSERGTITGRAALRTADAIGPDSDGRVLRADAGYEHRLSRRLYLISGASYQERRIQGAKVGSFTVQFGISIRGERL